jgi:c-di-GMP-binding flagellar brake protein YcgR
MNTNSSNKKDIKQTLINCYKESMHVFAWALNSTQIVKAELKIKLIDAKTKKIHLVPDAKSKPYLDEMIGGLGRINLIIPEASFIFDCEVQQFDEDGVLVVTFPKYYRFYERRRFERIDPFIPIKVQLKNKNKIIQKDCLDIGVGGFSLVFSKVEHVPFKKGETLEDVLITRLTESNSAKVKVTNVLKLKPYTLENCPYGGTRVSFAFIEPAKDLNDFILTIINGQKNLMSDVGKN